MPVAAPALPKFEITTKTIDTLVACTEAAQKMAAEVTSLTLAKAKEAYGMQADASATVLRALGERFGATLTDQPAVAAWQKLIGDGAGALDRFSEQVNEAVEQGNTRIKEAMETVAGQVKDSSAQLTAAFESLGQKVTKK